MKLSSAKASGALLVCMLAVGCSSAAFASACDLPNSAHRIHVRDFQAAGDGKTDDGPAIRAAIKSSIAGSKPASVEFERGKVYRIASVEDGYAFQFSGTENVTLQGNGAELSLLPPAKVVRISNSVDINLCGLTIDYSPLPFIQGMVVASDKAAGTFELEIEHGFDIPSIDAIRATNATKKWEFAKPYEVAGEFDRRVRIDAVQATPGSQRITITPGRSADLSRLVPNVTRLVMAMPGAGQTGNFAFRIMHSSRVQFEAFRIYAVPKLSFYVAENHGPISFSDVEQRRRPGTTRVMTGWRGVFHIKDNRAPLRWDGCYIEGAFDDAFNLSATYQLVMERLDSDRWRLQDMSADDAPMYKPGDRLQAIDLSPERKILGESKIISVSQTGRDSVVTISPPLPLKARLSDCKDARDGTGPRDTAKISARRRISGDACGSRIINLDAANEASVIRDCTVHGGIRLRSKSTFERSKLHGRLQITASPSRIGPLPNGVIIRDSELTGHIKIGPDANMDRVVNSEYPQTDWQSGERWAQNILFQGNRISSAFRAEGASLSLTGNDITFPRRRKFELSNSGPVYIKNLTSGGKTISDLSDWLMLGPNMTKADIHIQ